MSKYLKYVQKMYIHVFFIETATSEKGLLKSGFNA